MNIPRATTILPVALLMLIFSSGESVYGQAAKKGDTAIEKFAKLLGDALKEVTGEKKKARPAVVRQLMAQPAAVLPEAEKKERLERMNAWSRAMQQWLAAAGALKEDQVAALKEKADAKVDKEQQRWLKQPPDNQQRNQGLPDYFVLKFTATNGAAAGVDLTPNGRSLPDLLTGNFGGLEDAQLTQQQSNTITNAVLQRVAFQKEANLGYVLNLLDRELFLTAEQRETLSPPIAKRIDANNVCYSFHPQTYYFPQKSLKDVLQSVKLLNIWNPAQKMRANALADAATAGSYNSEQYILFQSNEGIDNWNEKLAAESISQKARLQNAINVRVAFHRASCDLSDKAGHHLTVAGKGAVDEVIMAWKKQARKQVQQQMERMARFNGQNFAFAVNVAQIPALESNAIWQHALESQTPEGSDHLARRSKIRLDAMAKFVVGMLDRELWLRPEQREKLITAVGNELPSPDYRGPNDAYFREVTWLCIAMFKLSKQDIAMLTPPQKKAYETMKKMFTFNGNIVRFNMKNGGQMAIQVPGKGQDGQRGFGQGFF